MIVVEALLPGLGFVMVTPTVPAEEAVPVAVSFVEDANVVCNMAPPNEICAPPTKLLPFAVSVNAPTGMLVGLTLPRTGTGFHSVTLLVPFALASAALTAFIVTAFELGTLVGAV